MIDSWTSMTSPEEKSGILELIESIRSKVVRISLKSHSKTEHGAQRAEKCAGRIIVHQVFGMDRIARSFLWELSTS